MGGPWWPASWMVDDWGVRIWRCQLSSHSNPQGCDVISNKNNAVSLVVIIMQSSYSTVYYDSLPMDCRHKFVCVDSQRHVTVFVRIDP